MSSRVYKLKFSKPSYQLNDDYDRLSDIEKEKISDMEADAFFDMDEDDKYTFFIIVKPMELKAYLSVLNENFIPYDINDVSDDILRGNLDVEAEITQVNPLNSLRYSFFVDDLNDWLYENLDIDIILDRISSIGIDSLRKVEKEFLNNYNN
jgi:hypothetical protein